MSGVVSATEPALNVDQLTVKDLTDTSVEVYWHSVSAAGQGEYRYALSQSGLSGASWSDQGVINGAQTGNLYGSKVVIDNLSAGKFYYVEVRKWYLSSTSPSEKLYGETKIISFTKGSIEANSCIDSDGGDDLYTKGTLTRLDRPGLLTDRCYIKQDDYLYLSTDNCAGSKCYLEEAYCDAPAFETQYSPSYFFPCPYGCEDGVCLLAPIGDMDLMVNDLISLPPAPLQPGTNVTLIANLVNNSSQTLEDRFVVSWFIDNVLVEKKVWENYAPFIAYENREITYNWLEVSAGLHLVKVVVDDDNNITESNEENNSRFDVFLVETGVACSDPDNGSIYSRGTTTGLNSLNEIGNSTDHCTSPSILVEYSCSIGGYVSVEQKSCPIGCLDGACVQDANLLCTDSDAGQNQTIIKGSASGRIVTKDENVTFNDHCFDNKKINEATCNNGFVGFTLFDCLGSCLDGICIESSSVEETSPVATQEEPTEAEQLLRQRITHLEYKISELEEKVIELEKNLASSVDQSLIDRLRGRILLQVEENGEAWYLDDITDKKYYLKDGDSAYVALNAFGLGVSNENIAKIPIGIEARAEAVDSDNDGLDDKLEEAIGTDLTKADSDGDGYPDGQEVKDGFNPLAGAGAKLAGDLNLATRLRGKILLQVQSRGEAWYVNPADGKRYYMKDGDQAYQIMRFLSLGITNTDLRKIAVGELN